MAELDTTELPPVVDQKRQAARKKTFLGGVSISRDGACTINCTIRDISESGAKIKVASGQVIPTRGYLIVTGRDVLHETLVAWARRDEFGLKIVATHPLASLDTPELRGLRRLLVEKLPRTSVA